MPSLKIFYCNEVRRVDLTSLLPEGTEFSFKQIVHVSKTLFSELQGKVFHITYIDDEGDIVTISSDEELTEAVKVMGAGNVLRFRITADADPPTPAQAPQGKLVHTFVACDECGVSPIIGIRFKCTVRHDFDLCETCEARTTQPFPMVKMYKPRQRGPWTRASNDGCKEWMRCGGRRGGSGCERARWPRCVGSEGPYVSQKQRSSPCHGFAKDVTAAAAEALHAFTTNATNGSVNLEQLLSTVMKESCSGVEVPGTSQQQRSSPCHGFAKDVAAAAAEALHAFTTNPAADQRGETCSGNGTDNSELHDAEEQLLSIVMKESGSGVEVEVQSTADKTPAAAAAVAVPIAAAEEQKDQDFTPSVPSERWTSVLQELAVMGFTDTQRITSLLDSEARQSAGAGGADGAGAGTLPPAAKARVIAALLGLPPQSFTA